MKKILLYTLLLSATLVFSQDFKLVKGAITENLLVNDSIGETMAIYTPSNFSLDKSWPVIFVTDMGGNAKSSISMLVNSAEKEGYVLASSYSLNDSLSLSENVLIANRMLNAIVTSLPITNNRMYTAGFESGAKFASILPTFIPDINGVISVGATLGSIDILNVRQKFQFIGVVNRSDYNFPDMLEERKVLDKLKFPNQLFVFDGEKHLPDGNTLAMAMRMLTLSSMAKEHIVKDSTLIVDTYNELLVKANTFFTNDQPILASYLISDIERVLAPLITMDSLKTTKKSLRRSTSYKKAIRTLNNIILKEDFAKGDYSYYLEEDIITYNYANLGWWNYQMKELDKLDKSSQLFERQSSSRLRGFINALIADNVDCVASAEKVDMDALNLLYMIKTITAPKEYESYLKVITISAGMEDFGTALFYLEELLKNGYTDKAKLYTLENSALLRITPEFNELIEKYLTNARYDIIPQ
ncbi:alpha/beta hydrolase [Maribacter confluentis]|uniref:Alpha/beta hydrolase n=1 Tax=Maribacter confluentis TaxID=1656093 RepID=A0ABT8RSS7_9FLAO|nr:alpha/beta hydrolase [Maribacter confluentis]MDO1513966.1 alpha/beta hydrolase [Maribacter confluentis]